MNTFVNLSGKPTLSAMHVSAPVVQEATTVDLRELTESVHYIRNSLEENSNKYIQALENGFSSLEVMANVLSEEMSLNFQVASQVELDMSAHRRDEKIAVDEVKELIAALSKSTDQKLDESRKEFCYLLHQALEKSTICLEEEILSSRRLVIISIAMSFVMAGILLWKF